MRFDNAFANSQPEAGSWRHWRVREGTSIEALKDFFEFLRRNHRTPVHHGHFQLSVPDQCGEPYGRAGRGKLHSIFEKIDEDLLDLHGIHRNRWKIGSKLDVDATIFDEDVQ